MIENLMTVGGFAFFFLIYLPLVAAYVAGGFGELKKEMFASFGKVEASI